MIVWSKAIRHRAQPLGGGVLDHPLSRMMTAGLGLRIRISNSYSGVVARQKRKARLRQRDRAIQYSRDGSCLNEISRRTGCPAFAGHDDRGHTLTISPRLAREFCRKRPALNSEGAGNAGRLARPQPCVQNKKAHKHSHHGHTGNTRHSPRNGFNSVYRALPGDRAFLPPSSAKVAFHRLDASVGASGPHDFAVRRSAPSSEAPPASTASRPAFVTIASRPSKGTGPDRYNAVSTWASSGISEIPKLG
jgi:hypothetical protein